MTKQDVLKRYQKEIVARINKGEGTSAIAKDFNCSAGTVWLFLKSIGVPPANKRSKKYGICETKKDEITQRYDNGESVYSIAKSIGITKASLQKKMHQWGIETSRGRTVNYNNLLKDKTQQVLSLHDQNKSQYEIAKITGHTQPSVNKLLQSKNVKPRDWKYSVDESFFETIDTEEKAYILGWWYSDGNVMPSGKCRLQIADKPILERIRIILQSEGELQFVKRRKPHHKDQWCLNIDRAKIRDDLIHLGCMPNKSLKLKFPTSEQVPPNLLNHFVRGYFDGDGSINTGLTIVSTLTFCQSLKDILPCTITNIYQRYKDREPDKSSHQLFVGKRKEVQKIYTWMYDNATIWLERKRLQF